MKKKYAVYVVLQIVQNGEMQDAECMVFNVTAESNGGAEHVILDTIPMCNNALAFTDTEMSGEYFNTLLSRSRVYDLRDFRARCNAVTQSRINSLEMLYDELEQARAECAALEKERAQIDMKLQNARAFYERTYETLREQENMYGMKYSPDELQGLA